MEYGKREQTDRTIIFRLMSRNLASHWTTMIFHTCYQSTFVAGVVNSIAPVDKDKEANILVHTWDRRIGLPHVSCYAFSKSPYKAHYFPTICIAENTRSSKPPCQKSRKALNH